MAYMKKKTMRSKKNVRKTKRIRGGSAMSGVNDAHTELMHNYPELYRQDVTPKEKDNYIHGKLKEFERRKNILLDRKRQYEATIATTSKSNPSHTGWGFPTKSQLDVDTNVLSDVNVKLNETNISLHFLNAEIGFHQGFLSQHYKR